MKPSEVKSWTPEFQLPHVAASGVSHTRINRQQATEMCVGSSTPIVLGLHKPGHFVIEAWLQREGQGVARDQVPQNNFQHIAKISTSGFARIEVISQGPGQGQEQSLGHDTRPEAISHSTPGSGSSRLSSVIVSIQQVVERHPNGPMFNLIVLVKRTLIIFI